MKTMTYLMAGALVATAFAANAQMGGGGSSGGAGASAGGSAGASVGGAGGAGLSGSTGSSVNTGSNSSGTGGGVGTGVNAGTGSIGGSLGVGANASGVTGTGNTRPSGVIDDTGRSGTSSISTQSDSAARINTPSRVGNNPGAVTGVNAGATVRPSLNTNNANNRVRTGVGVELNGGASVNPAAGTTGTGIRY